jgi:hypothetical protein
VGQFGNPVSRSWSSVYFWADVNSTLKITVL